MYDVLGSALLRICVFLVSLLAYCVVPKCFMMIGSVVPELSSVYFEVIWHIFLLVTCAISIRKCFMAVYVGDATTKKMK